MADDDEGRGGGRKGFGYTRIIPKFLQQYAHLLVGKKNRYSDTNQLDRQPREFASVEDLEQDGAVVVEQEQSTRKRRGPDVQGDQEDADDADDDSAEVVQPVRGPHYLVPSEERFSSKRVPMDSVLSASEAESAETQLQKDPKHVFNSRKNKKQKSGDEQHETKDGEHTQAREAPQQISKKPSAKNVGKRLSFNVDES